MHFAGQVYRHPIEARTPLLEVTAGCSHNKCTFCTMYRNTPFKLSPLSHVEEDLIEMKSMGVEIKRIFLVNGEPFILSTDKLVEISELIHKYFPEIETITCYASVKSLKSKSLDELKKLRKMKYNQLHIGLETAYDPALKQMNKGFTQKEAYENIKKVMEAGFEWDAIVMMGVAGKGMSDINVKETAKLLNELPPYLISIMSTSVSSGSELEVLRDRGDFIEPSELEMLEEEKNLLELLEFDDAYFFGGHVFNLAPINGSLKVKDKIIKEIDHHISQIDEKILNGTYQRPNI